MALYDQIYKRIDEKVYRTPKQIAAEMAKLDKENAALLAAVMEVLK